MLSTQVLDHLGSIEGKCVAELGAGIGRFTGELAKTAAQVTAYDFMESLVIKNKERNGSLSNVEFAVQDVTQLDRPPNSCDVVFSNWLFMYLSDREVEDLASRILTWVSAPFMVCLLSPWLILEWKEKRNGRDRNAKISSSYRGR